MNYPNVSLDYDLVLTRFPRGIEGLYHVWWCPCLALVPTCRFVTKTTQKNIQLIFFFFRYLFVYWKVLYYIWKIGFSLISHIIMELAAELIMGRYGTACKIPKNSPSWNQTKISWTFLPSKVFITFTIRDTSSLEWCDVNLKVFSLSLSVDDTYRLQILALQLISKLHLVIAVGARTATSLQKLLEQTYPTQLRL